MNMFEDRFTLAMIVAMLMGIGGFIFIVLMTKFFEKRDRRQAARKLNS